MKRPTISLLAMLICIGISHIQAQSLTCNNHVNISVGNLCNIDLSVDAFLEGDATHPEILAGHYEYRLKHLSSVLVTGNQNGPITGGTLDMSPYIDKTLTFEVVYTPTGNYCWGTALIEDKIPPQLHCDCPVGGNIAGNYDPECSLSCYELPIVQGHYWNRLQNSLVPNDPEDLLDNNGTDNCNNTSTSALSYTDRYIDVPDCGGTKLQRTWYINIGSGPSVSCVKEYFFAPLKISEATPATFGTLSGTHFPNPIEDRIVLPKAVVEIPSCGIGNTPEEIAEYYDNPLTLDQDTDGDGYTPQQLDYDNVIENNEGIWYAYPHYYVAGRNPEGPHAQPLDNSVCNMLVGFTDVMSGACAPGCSGNSRTIRTWTIMDWCTGEIITYDQVIKIIDGQGPNLVVRDLSVSVDPWECEATVSLPRPEHLFDDCDNITNYSVTNSLGYQMSGNSQNGYVAHNVPVGQHTFRYVAVDCCNNRTHVNVNITVTDHTPPVAITREIIVTNLTNIGNPNSPDSGISKIFARNVDNGSYDGCGPITIQIRRTDTYCDPADTLWGEYVKFCCDDLMGQEYVEIEVELLVSDLGGNVNKSWATIRLEDKSNPSIFCPDPMILTCDMDYNDFSMTGLPDGVSACGSFVFDFVRQDILDNTNPQNKPANFPPLYDIDGDGIFDEVPAYDQSCGFGALKRDFEDSDGNRVCTQWLVIERTGDFDPRTIDFPNDMVVDCDDYDAGEPTWLNDNACNLIGVSVEADTFYQERGSCMTIVNNWHVIDWCLYDASNPVTGKYSDVQIIQIIDTEDPELFSVDSLVYDVGLDCLSKGVVLEAAAVDDGICSSAWIGWEVTIDLNADWTQDYFYSHTVPSRMGGEPNPFYIEKTANGETVEIVLPDGIPSSKIWHRAVWRATDGCKNNISHTRYFQITDNKAPTPYCHNLSTAFMENGEVELWAADFSIGSFDNCTAQEELLYTFTDVPPPPRDDTEYDSSNDLMWYNGTFWYYDSETGSYEDRDDYGDEIHYWDNVGRTSGKIFTEDELDDNGFVDVLVYVWDGCENIDYCTVRLRIVDNDGGGMVAGRIATEEGTRVEGVMTELEAAMPGYPRQQMTDAQGNYSFENAPFNIDYRVKGVDDNDDYLNGVSTLDLVLIQKHILGQDQFSSPYKIIAADVNSDNHITALDLIELRKLILGVYDELPESDSWKYISKDENLSTDNVWTYNMDQTIMTMSADMMDQDFVAVKMGDVNSNAEILLTDQSIDTRSAVQFVLDDRSVVTNQYIEFDITSEEIDLGACQFTLGTQGMEIMGIEGLEETEYFIHDERVTVSKNDIKEGFRLTVKAKVLQGGNLSNMVQINSSITKAEAYLGSRLETKTITLRSNSEYEFTLYQNRPNPFVDVSYIGFELPSAQKVTLSLFDVNGKLLREITQLANKGFNTIEIDGRTLQTTGLIYYQLSTKEHTATKHMVLLK